MEDYIYNLFLTSEQGWSLFGTLRIQIPPFTADGGAPVMRAAPYAPSLQTAPVDALAPATAELTPIPITGSLSVPLLSLFRQVPLRGTLYGTAAGIFTFVLDSGNARPAVGLQMTPFGSEDYGGFLVWSTSNFSELVFSLLARPLPRTA